jgi:CRP-like cAMP-binding protein
MTLKHIEPAFLQKIPLFAGLSEEKLKKITAIIEVRSVSAGTNIIVEGTTGSELFILLEGEVEVSRALLLKTSGRGMDQHDKGLLRLTGSDYAFFGELALFDQCSERTATVAARSNCTVAVLSQEKFFKLTESDHDIGYKVLMNIIPIVGNRLQKTTKDVLKLTTALSLALQR